MTDSQTNSQVKSLLATFTSNLNNDLQKFTPFSSACKKTGIQPSHAFILIILLVLFLTISGIFENLFVTLFGMLYPAYMSFKAININDNEAKKTWLTYWIVFGLLTSFDESLSFILYFVPGYYAFKLIFYVWMFYPRTNGATVIFEKILRPLLLKVEEFAYTKQQ